MFLCDLILLFIIILLFLMWKGMLQILEDYRGILDYLLVK